MTSPYSCDPAAAVLGLMAQRVPRLGGGHLVCVDGRSGSGKSTLAAALQAETCGQVVHLDALLDGWEGLPDVADTLTRDVLAPLAEGRPASYRRYDWHAGQFTERVPVTPGALLIVEGVGAGARATAPYRSALVWLDAPDSVRRRRALARDGDAFTPHWDSWARAEDAYLAAEQPREAADLVVSVS